VELVMLVEARMWPVPKGIEVVNDWGQLTVRYGTDTGQAYVHAPPFKSASGRHMHLKGEPDAFVQWLKPFDDIHIQKEGTNPIQQQFSVVHVDEDA